MKQTLKIVLGITCITILTLIIGCADAIPLRIHDGKDDNDISKVENLIAQFIIEKGFKNSVIYIADDSNQASENMLSGAVDLVNKRTADTLTVDYTKISIAGKYYYLTTLDESVPEIISFLQKFQINDKIIAESIDFADYNSTDLDAAVLYFLRNYQSIWKTWASNSVYERVKAEVNMQIDLHPQKEIF